MLVLIFKLTKKRVELKFDNYFVLLLDQAYVYSRSHLWFLSWTNLLAALRPLIGLWLEISSLIGQEPVT